MRYTLCITLFLALDVANALWPKPRTLTTGTSFLKLSSSFSITPAFSNPPQDLLDAVSRTQGHLGTDKLGRLVPGRGSSDSDALGAASSLPSLSLHLSNDSEARPIATEATLEIGTRDESYSMTVPDDGTEAEITANTTLGLLRGLTTFEQMWYDWDGTTYTNVAPVEVPWDGPAFPHRGLMLDTSRNYFGVTDIKRTLDAMSWAKMSVFHWHVVDSQSFPLVVDEFPTLSQDGAYSPSEVYSTSDVEDIASYAAARGIDVVMEIDTPGHTAIISESFPQHIACAFPGSWQHFNGEPPFGQLRIASNDTLNFTQTLLTSVAQRLPSKMFSTGGDEVVNQCYVEDQETQSELAERGITVGEALNEFVTGTHDALRGIGKTPVVWEEMVLEQNITLGNDTVVMVWISSEHAAQVVAKDFRIVHAPSDYFYLDCGAGEWLGNTPNATSWCDPFKSWQKAYTFDPLANISPSQASLVLGGQQLLWTEQSSPTNLDPIVWPRAASSAEVFWTGGHQEDGSPLNITEALPRLQEHRFRLVQRGVGAIALQPTWCALRPGECNSG